MHPGDPGGQTEAMEPTLFLTTKHRLMAEAHPSTGADLDGMAMDFDAYLWQSPAIDTVDIRRTPDPACLITATCHPTPGQSAADLEDALTQVWLTRLRYPHFEAHILTTTPDHVRLDAITQIAPTGFYVTATITCDYQVTCPESQPRTSTQDQ